MRAVDLKHILYVIDNMGPKAWGTLTIFKEGMPLKEFYSCLTGYFQ